MASRQQRAEVVRAEWRWVWRVVEGVLQVHSQRTLRLQMRFSRQVSGAITAGESGRHGWRAMLPGAHARGSVRAAPAPPRLPVWPAPAAT